MPCLALCSWRRRELSILTGLGMKPISQPSFTSRPIHQSLLNFYTGSRDKRQLDVDTDIDRNKSHPHVPKAVSVKQWDYIWTGTIINHTLFQISKQKCKRRERGYPHIENCCKIKMYWQHMVQTDQKQKYSINS